jgi:hypothetical protein
MIFEGNSLLGLVNRLRGAFYHLSDRTMTVYGLSVGIAAKTADYTMLSSDFSITVSCSSANITITLPTAASSTGQIYAIVKIDATDYSVIIDPPGAETINGITAWGLAGRFSSAIFQSDGTSWYYLSRPRDDIYNPKTANYTLGSFDGTVDCTANSFTVTLPTAVGAKGRVYNIKNSGNGVITIATTSSQTIDGNASGVLKLVQYDNLTVQSNGANWLIL